MEDSDKQLKVIKIWRNVEDSHKNGGIITSDLYMKDRSMKLWSIYER